MPDLPPPIATPVTTTIIASARAGAPAWRIERSGQMIRLVEPGRTPVVGVILGHKLTRHGTAIGVRAGERVFSITVMPALCRSAASPRPARYAALVRIDGRVLDGCYLPSPPGERPLLD